MRVQLKLTICRSGKTQRQIAYECRIAEPRFSEIVRGWRDPSDDERERIAGILQQPIDDLFAVEAA